MNILKKYLKKIASQVTPSQPSPFLPRVSVFFQMIDNLQVRCFPDFALEFTFFR